MSTWLLCDYGEVLSTAPPADEWDALRRAAGDRPEPEFHSIYWQHRPAYDRGDLSARQYWQLVLGEDPAPARLERIVEADRAIWLHPNQASVDAANRARDRGVRLALFSNAPVEVAAGIEAQEWLDPFQPRFFSCRLRAIKPEPAAYQAILAGLGELGAAAGDIVFFDDRPANVAAALEAGLRAFVFSDPAQFDSVN